ncbi:MAG: hypothetical protein ACNI27_07885 [Desulfovibrio sp.]
MTREECIEMIETIYSRKKDTQYPSRAAHNPIMLLASFNGYVTGTDFGYNRYGSAEELYEGLLSVEEHYEEEPLVSLFNNLKHIL